MVEIKITGNTPLEALASVTAFGWHSMKDPEVHTAATRVLDAEQAKAPVPASAAAPVPPSAVPPVAPPAAPVTGPAPTAAPSYTMEQVSKAGADLLALNPAKMPELMDLLQQFGVPAISELKAEQMGPFATALRGLGAQL